MIEVPKSLICPYPLCAINFIKLHLMSKLLWKPWLEIQSLAMMSSPPPPQRNVKERLLSLAKKKLPHCASSWINGISPDVRKIEPEGNLSNSSAMKTCRKIQIQQIQLTVTVLCIHVVSGANLIIATATLGSHARRGKSN